MKKKFLLLAVSLFLLTSCGTVKLTNGGNAVVTFKDNEGISSQELYDNLKKTYGSEAIVNMIDTYLLEKEYETTDDEKKYISEVIKSTKSAAEQYETDYLSYINQAYGLTSESAFKDYISLNYKRNLWITDYAEKEVSEKQINEYYETMTIGDIEASHILISTEATDNMTEDEKDALNKKSLETAKEIITKLDAGEDFAALAKEYSDDEASKKEGGYLGYFNRGKMTDKFESAVIDLKVGTYSKTPVETEFGYHIIYKTAQKDKPELKDVESSIKSTVASEMLSTDQTLYLTAIKALREKYEMTIKDSVIKDGYDKIMSN